MLSRKAMSSADFKFQSDSINTMEAEDVHTLKILFKFQSDSINTTYKGFGISAARSLNSNLILLIPWNFVKCSTVAITFKFQSDSINTGFGATFCR